MSNPIIHTINLVNDRLAELKEKEKDTPAVLNSVSHKGKRNFLEKLKRNLGRFYNGALNNDSY